MLAGLSGFLYSPWMLLGLAVIVIPPIIHLLNRRRYDIVDWGAMQFLQISEITRRRLMLEELLLMLLRMGLLGVLVFALAGPFLDSSVPTVLGKPSRDVVIIIDGSASMSATDEKEPKSPHDKAREWALAFLDDLSPGDSVSLLLARQQTLPLVGELSSDMGRVRDQLKKLPAPAGGCNWPAAIKKAHAILETSQKGQREIILLGDGQRFSWADTETLFRWEALANELKTIQSDDTIRPRVWAVNLAAKRSTTPPNWSLAKLTTSRPVAAVKREIRFEGELLLSGQKELEPPHRLRLLIDNKDVRDLPKFDKKLWKKLVKDSRVPFSFTHTFSKPGSHLVSVIVEADPPPGRRGKDYIVKDRVPGDNRQDIPVLVMSALPVLLVDGDDSRSARERGTDFLMGALTPKGDPTPVVQARMVPINDFSARELQTDPKPQVLVLHNVAKLTTAQQDAVSTFLADGGGLLVTLGERAEADFYNQQLYRGGEGWLPARVDKLEGDENKPANSVRPDPTSFNHPALEIFRKIKVGGLSEARFAKWWKLTTPGKHAPGRPVGLMRDASDKYPFLVERDLEAGKVLLCAEPLDNSWGTNVTDLEAFVPLVHELVYYLARARLADFTIAAGQPLRWRTDSEATIDGFSLKPPVGETWPLSDIPGKAETYQAQLISQPKGKMLVYDNARDTGIYELTTPKDEKVYYVVPPEAQEMDLTASDKEDRDRVAKLFPVSYQDDRQEIVESSESGLYRQDFWMWLLLGLVGLLCFEVWMTRRMVRNRA